MNDTSEWCVKLWDLMWLKNVILMGVGWWQYQDFQPNLYTRILLGGILRKDKKHSLRDSYSAKRVGALGLGVLNTGCPTLWRLNQGHCAEIPQSKADSVLLTFTEYNQKPESDRLLFDILRRNYSRIYYWPQQFGDHDYIRRIGDKHTVILEPALEALDAVLKEENVDFVGTRLHAGIRALQYKRRTIIIAVDNRAAEMGVDFNLPILDREKISSDLQQTICSSWPTEIRLDDIAISLWKSQLLDPPTSLAS